MNRLQANLCLLCVTLCWSAEIVLYACIPDVVPAFATSCVTALAGAALLFVPFRARLAAAVDDAIRWTSIAGFASNFLGPLFVWWFWTRVSRTPFSLRTPRDLLRHCLVLVVMAAFETAIVAPSVALVYPEVDAVFFAWAVFGNTAGFPILLGIPLSILLQEELGFEPA